MWDDLDFELLYDRLLEFYGSRGWWPLVREKGGRPTYRPCSWRQSRTPDEIFEIGVGAVLTQRSTWGTTAAALARLSSLDALTAGGLARLSDDTLAESIRPCGTFRRKLATLRTWVDWFQVNRPSATHAPEAASLQMLSGFGPETVDSILVYGFGVPRFIADAYARRIFGRVLGTGPINSYQRLQREVESCVTLDREHADELHALLVELGKRLCKKEPDCIRCPLRYACAYGSRDL